MMKILTITNLEVHINLWHGNIVGDFLMELSRGNTDVCITLGGKEITVPGNETKKYREIGCLQVGSEIDFRRA
ncbi:MAG: hypothetical protein ACXQT5_06020 [Candidatus Syntropharchaeia archaeon]